MFKLIKKLIILGLFIALVLSGGFYWLVSSPLILKNDPLDFHINPGSGLRVAARDVVAAGVVIDPLVLVALGKLLRVDTAIKAGSYEIREGISALGLFEKLTRGDVTQSEIVFIEGWSFRQMRDRIDAHPDIKHVRRIGIDEFAIRKGHVYKTIVVDLDTGRIIHVGDGKGKEALEGFWKRVRRNKVKIEIVTSDLSAAFIASVMENAPDAVHVYDKFHVAKLVNEAVDAVRRNVYAQEEDLEKRKIIKGSRWLLLTKDKDIFDDEKKKRLDNILKTNTPLFHAYYLREDLDQIWMQDSKEEAERQLAYWCERARETKMKPFIKVANTLMARRTGILAWYDAPVTNAMLEGINNKIKVMKRRAYGYRDDEYFTLLLLGLHDKTNAIRG